MLYTLVSVNDKKQRFYPQDFHGWVITKEQLDNYSTPYVFVEALNRKDLEQAYLEKEHELFHTADDAAIDNSDNLT